MWWRKSPYKIAKTKVFGHNFNKTRQTLSDVIAWRNVSSERVEYRPRKNWVRLVFALLLAKSFTLSLVKFLSPLICQIFKPSHWSNL